MKHTTANGKVIDMAALASKYANTRAVGNMNVNANGDIIDSEGRVINEASKRVNKLYNKTIERARAQRPELSSSVTEALATDNQSVRKSELDNEFDSYDQDFVTKK